MVGKKVQLRGAAAGSSFDCVVIEPETTERTRPGPVSAIADSDEPSQTTLVERTGIDRSTMADIVRRLTARGLVQRRRTRRDARRYAVRLTDKGENALRLAEPARLLLTVGFLGGFTTFSSFSLETVTLLEGGSFFYAAMNIAANLGLCFLAAFLGLSLARTLAAF